MANWYSNTAISRPIQLHDIQPDVNLNGMMFSAQIGLMYVTQEGQFDPISAPVQLPSPNAPGSASIQ